MQRFVAFLRGINVSGQKIIKMEALREAFSESGFVGVKTYIQSGNVLFDSDETDTDKIILSIEQLIEKSFGFSTDVIVRKITDIEAIVNSTLFNPMESDDEKKYYITFLKSTFKGTLPEPLQSKNKDVEVFYQNGCDFFSVCTLYKGKYGFPNIFIEKLTGIPATTRNPITLRKIVSL